MEEAQHAVAAEDDRKLEDEPEAQRESRECNRERFGHGNWAILPDTVAQASRPARFGASLLCPDGVP